MTGRFKFRGLSVNTKEKVTFSCVEKVSIFPLFRRCTKIIVPSS